MKAYLLFTKFVLLCPFLSLALAQNQQELNQHVLNNFKQICEQYQKTLDFPTEPVRLEYTLTPQDRPSKIIAQYFQAKDRFLTDCNLAIQLAFYKTLLDMWGGTLFNHVFKSDSFDPFLSNFETPFKLSNYLTIEDHLIQERSTNFAYVQLPPGGLHEGHNFLFDARLEEGYCFGLAALKFPLENHFSGHTIRFKQIQLDFEKIKACMRQEE